MLLMICDWCAPSQDRLWRKTRSRNPDPQVACRGVDSNRNWSFHWNGSNSLQIVLLTFTLHCSMMNNVIPTDALPRESSCSFNEVGNFCFEADLSKITQSSRDVFDGFDVTTSLIYGWTNERI